MNSVEGHSEPSWFKDIKFDDSDTEQIADEGEDNLASEFHLNFVLTLAFSPVIPSPLGHSLTMSCFMCVCLCVCAWGCKDLSKL